MTIINKDYQLVSQSMLPNSQSMLPNSQSMLPNSQSMLPNSQTMTPNSQTMTPNSQSMPQQNKISQTIYEKCPKGCCKMVYNNGEKFNKKWVEENNKNIEKNIKEKAGVILYCKNKLLLWRIKCLDLL